MLKRMRLLVVATFGFGSITAPAIAKVIYNLPLLLAFDVLRTVLRAARKEGKIASKGTQLGDLMDAAQHALIWVDWHSLREGVRRRNGVAHDGELFSATECLQDIGNVRSQLIAWAIIPPEPPDPPAGT